MLYLELKIRRDSCFIITLTRRRILRTMATNLTYLACLIGRLDLTRFNSRIIGVGLEPDIYALKGHRTSLYTIRRNGKLYLLPAEVSFAFNDIEQLHSTLSVVLIAYQCLMTSLLFKKAS